MEENIRDYLPLGTIVVLKGQLQKLMIVSRAVLVGEDKTYFDYGACVYPIGVIEDKYIYFNRTDILQVVHAGYSDDADELLQKNIALGMEKLNIK